MTTIACNRTMMASDSRYSYGEYHQFSTDKLYRVGDSIYGESGGEDSLLFIDWIKRGADPTRKPVMADPDKDRTFMVLELHSTGIYLWDENLIRIPVREPFYAVGSGFQVALYCMKELKLNPKRAVLEACKIDRYTAPPIQVMTL